jgi:nucleotide-binding universal stress UspA family protein
MSACIVCGIDGSREAEKAAAVAARLARNLGSRAVLVHVQESARKRRAWARVPRPGRRRRRRRLLKATAAGSCFPGDTHLRLETGDPTSALLDAAREADAELLVVSTGVSGTASPVLLGHTATGLMRESPCPVVIVPTRSEPPLDVESIRDVVCALEGRPGDGAVLGLAADLATRLGGRLHAVTDRDDALNPGELGIDALPHVVRAPADEAVKGVADRVRAGLAVVGSPSDVVPGSSVNVPLAIALAADGDIPIVVLTRAAKLHVGSGHYELAASAA